MKKKITKSLQFVLKLCAIRILKKYHPEIIAITGSVGKTSTRDAIYTVLKSKFDVRKNEKNFNAEIGVPLTIIGAKSVKNFSAIFKNTFFGKKYPRILVLEMGADHPGDLKYLTSFIKPKIAVITRVACSHLEFFCDLDGVAKEKGTLVESLNKEGWAVLNYDDENVREMNGRTKGKVLYFGLNGKANIKASNLKMDWKGLNFEVAYEGQKEKFFIPVIGKHQIYSALAAITCGLIYNLSLKEISNNLKNFELPENRTNILNGIKNSILINDVYNANPESMMAAIDVLVDLASKKNRKVVVLGDMFELGADSAKLHQNIGKYLSGKVNVVILVGKMMKHVFTDLEKEFLGNIYWFENSSRTSEEIGNIIDQNDIILVKGSRGMKMEKVVEKIKL